MSDDAITADDVLAAYQAGYFPMADSVEGDDIGWYSPDPRGVLPLESFHVPRSLQKILRRDPYRVTVDRAFASVISACAAARSEKRKESWINQRIVTWYCELASRGIAHSVECWQDDKLVGGLYGVSLGGVFFGESMFSLATNASKIALVHLVERLARAGYRLLDTQYTNDHLAQFGVTEIPRRDYLVLLTNALKVSPNPSTRFLTVSDIKS